MVALEEHTLVGDLENSGLRNMKTSRPYILLSEEVKKATYSCMPSYFSFPQERWVAPCEMQMTPKATATRIDMQKREKLKEGRPAVSFAPSHPK
jgi:hypothetical protein